VLRFRSSMISSSKRKGFLAGKSETVEAPVPYIRRIHQSGWVEIFFSSDIHSVPNLTMIQNGTIEVDGEVFPVFAVEVVPGEDSDTQRLYFTWEVISQTNDTLTIQLHFNETEFVSANWDKEWLKITFRDHWMFLGTNGLVIKPEHRVVKKEMPP